MGGRTPVGVLSGRGTNPELSGMSHPVWQLSMPTCRTKKRVVPSEQGESPPAGCSHPCGNNREARLPLFLMIIWPTSSAQRVAVVENLTRSTHLVRHQSPSASTWCPPLFVQQPTPTIPCYRQSGHHLICPLMSSFFHVSCSDKPLRGSLTCDWNPGES